jgi:hypothetical protein
MAKKQVTMQLDEDVLKEIAKDAKKTKKAKQAVVNSRLKESYGL